MLIITFPKDEWADLQKRLNGGKEIYSLRVSDEYGKYHKGQILETEWGDWIKVLEIQTVTGGVEELKNKYPFFRELTEKMLAELGPYQEIDVFKFLKADS